MYSTLYCQDTSRYTYSSMPVAVSRVWLQDDALAFILSLLPAEDLDGCETKLNSKRIYNIGKLVCQQSLQACLGTSAVNDSTQICIPVWNTT